ncbi:MULTISPECIES: MlaD family protein [Gordonia]|uniref:MCE family protein n=1 Tax=Gordonia amicalis TaxID=89053 RepID=A0AAE4R5Z4_9ACTN|nr:MULTISPECIES: MCE family protein [Gordonia]ATD71011.1 MCE family protein [Gordonia sp. 1D]MCZ4579649.1 MCE family protein [Gordonia amicalis]MDJ0453106.1 MCE family protein [Gordonia amicalis]MDV6312462.1 MCE family protein [Gordonia amicalis]MDV7077423.1 MCE family protein [Gordonia amicalis]
MFRFIAHPLLILAAAALLLTGCSIGSNPFEEKITVTAEFDNANGLYVGNSVDVLGMSVGKVTAIEAKGGYALVTMEIDKAIKIPATAQAVTVSTSILTDRHVELTPVYREGPTMQNGDKIGLDRTRTPVEFDRVLNMVERLSAELGGNGKGEGPVANLMAVSVAMTEGNGQSMRNALGDLERALRLSEDGGAHSRRDITAIASNLARLSEAAANNDAVIRDLGSGFAQMSSFLASEDLGTGTTGKQLNDLMRETQALLITNRETIKNTLSSTTTVTTAMVDYRRNLSEFFDIAPMLMDNVYNAIDQETGALRVHGLVDKLLLDGQGVKEVCNLLGLRQLGCATGTLQDFGPDFGATSILAALVENAK